MRQGLRKVAKVESQAGFTLIELLIVITIFALLLAILLPALRLVRELGKRAACQANLKQIAVAWSTYLDDNEGYFYQGINANLNYGGWKGIVEWTPRPLNRYVGIDPNLETAHDAKIFLCPADRGGVPGYALREKAHIYLGTSYQTNIFLIGQDRCGPFSAETGALDEQISIRLKNLNCTKVSSSSRLLLVGDYGWINQWKPQPHPREDWKELAEWHGRINCHNLAFLDGHCEFVNIHKGLYVTDDYNVLPFKELFALAREVQEELP